jgi:hypothetical protein
VQQVSYGPLIMSIMLIMNCYTGFFNVRRGWQSLNTGPRFYLRLIRRTGWLWIYTSRTTDGCPFKPKKLLVPFLYPGVPSGWHLGKSEKMIHSFIIALIGNSHHCAQKKLIQVKKISIFDNHHSRISTNIYQHTYFFINILSWLNVIS